MQVGLDAGDQQRRVSRVVQGLILDGAWEIGFQQVVGKILAGGQRRRQRREGQAQPTPEDRSSGRSICIAPVQHRFLHEILPVVVGHRAGRVRPARKPRVS